MIKHLHMTCAYLTFTLFIIRFYWSLTGSSLLQTKLIKIAPHVIDSLLLLFAVLLLTAIGPAHPWILAKIVGLLFYIAFGTFAIKRGKTLKTKLINGILAILTILYIFGVAYHKTPASWF